MRLPKYKYIVALFLAGAAIQIFAALQKILHAPGTDMLFKISAGTMICAVVVGIFKVLTIKKKGDILNR